MAEHLSVRGVDVKIRNPWLVFLWAIVTFGIYYLVWYYKINRELRDYGRATGTPELGHSPLTSLLAITVGWLILVPPFVSTYHTFGRIATAQHVAGLGREASPGLGLVLYLVALMVLPVELPYGQIELNKVWRREREAPVGAAAAPSAPSEPATAPEAPSSETEPAAPTELSSAPEAPSAPETPSAPEAPEGPTPPSGPPTEPGTPDQPSQRPPDST